MTTELSKPVSRKVHVSGVGDFVVTLQADGVTIRKYRHRKGVFLPWDQVAKRGLEQQAWLLNGREWDSPLETLGKLRRLKQATGGSIKQTDACTAATL